MQNLKASMKAENPKVFLSVARIKRTITNETISRTIAKQKRLIAHNLIV